MSNHQTVELRPETPKGPGMNLSEASHYCWPNYSVGAGGYYTFSIYADAKIIGAGIKVHGSNKTALTSNYPEEGSWTITVANWEDDTVSFDVYAWFG